MLSKMRGETKNGLIVQMQKYSNSQENFWYSYILQGYRW